MMTIEEKARAYDEAIKRVEDIKTGKCETRFMFTEGLFEHIFPELSESEGERIRKDIVFYIAANHKDDGEKARWLYWLEQQAEQKPAWSEEDEDIRGNIIRDLRRLSGDMVSANQTYQKEIQWLNSLKERVLPKREWSKEDETMLGEIIDFFENGTVKLQHDLSLYASWLKSLRPQNTWKPSKQQIISLNYILNHYCYDIHKEEVSGLLEQLRKLKEE